jgi:hypothetical protein
MFSRVKGRDWTMKDPGKGAWRGDLNLKKIITICAECKKELKMAGSAAGAQALASLGPNEEVVCSHGICYECGVKLYGAEIMTSAGGLHYADRFRIF